MGKAPSKYSYSGNSFLSKEIETCPLEFIKIVIFHVLSEISHLKIKYGIKDGSIVAKITWNKHTHAQQTQTLERETERMIKG